MEGGAALTLSGVRFRVSYLLTGDEQEAREKANDICLEQTVEFPDDLLPQGPIREEIVGRIEELKRLDANSHRATINFAVETAAEELPQLLNVVFGNISIKPGIKVEWLDLPDELLATFRGPRFGRTGLRELFGVADRPLICTALKPMGLTNEELARQAYQFAKGGIDLIKDDHGLANQSFTPVEERISRCVEAVARANEETGGHSIYVPNITSRADRFFDLAARAKELGAGALLVAPGLVGMDTMRALAEDDGIGLPIMAHPSFSGSYVTSRVSGVSHRVLYGQLVRLAGADVSIFPNYGGRFSFTKNECRQIVQGTSEAMGNIAPIFPSPGGGMTTDRLADMREVYGVQFVALMGGGLHRHGPDLALNSRYFRELIQGAPSARP